ncbi:formate dehydrogenase subunit delta [Thiomonas sp.]|jgi:formate dehydrogenase subunit delta|uniref:formate dehydrogenase subunit delta n=1 Tax=Thiomonas sp. TaxID=2047785 RepID=UPI002603E9F9|nr:formate dehydrogenase subunit delta [Thiomonas sp.]
MKTEHLISMVNRIGQFFQAMPDHDEALEGIALHVKRFWEPRMRRELLDYLDKQGGKDISPVVLEALRQHRQLLA